MSDFYSDIEKTVQEYVLGKLSLSDAEEFEAYFLANPEIIEMVEVAQEVHLGLVTLNKRTSLERVEARSGKSIVTKLVALFSAPVPAYATALALMVVIMGSQLFENSQDELISEIHLARFSTEATRSSSKKLMIDFSKHNKSVGIFIKVARVDYRHYVLRLTGNDDAVWQSKPFEMSALKDALILVPQGVVKGSQSVEVIGVSGAGQETSVEFCNYNERCRSTIIER